MFTALLNALGMAFAMGWEILWPLVLGFALFGFLLLAAFLVWRFVATGGIDMLRMMNRPTRGDEAHHHIH
jgi:hypothetical protein